MNNKPKILIISLTYFPFIGGAEIAVQEITKRLTGDFEFEIITCNLNGRQKKEEKIDGVKVYRIGKGKLGKFFFSWLAYRKAVKLYEKNNYKIVWSIMANRAGLAALKFKEKFPNVKYLLTLQEGDSVSHVYKRTWFWFWRYKKIYEKADHIQVISKWLESRARKFGYKKEISVVPNGVSLSEKNQLTPFQKKEGKIILTVSRLVEKNGLEYLIRAFKLLSNTHGNVILKIIGDGPLKSRLEKLVKELNLGENIFLGKLDYMQTQERYKQADVFVRPSLSEGFGNVFIEAMAAEIPVIATPVGGIPDFLIDNNTGWFCEPKNPKNIAEKIQYVLDKKNNAEVERVVANAKKMVEEKYDWNIIAKKMSEIFNKLV